MLQDRFRKKTNRPGGGNNSSLETVDIADQVPEVDDILAGVDKALKLADDIDDRIKREQQSTGLGLDECTC